MTAPENARCAIPAMPGRQFFTMNAAATASTPAAMVNRTDRK